ncbi:hypothetical protein RHSIM_RhsimUnG0227600 [Rhododendron simsii]|uniref:DUF7769 domain-containing protein n=1 Tax=Rhododendron simsii TaxID=118357 RepID=A0A834FTG5_RHOSS|nr:hypothetical protein RHSIM_RhsimUnG0227600 [Rhododendron simsii]
MLLQSVDGKLKRSSVREVAELFPTSINIVRQIWNRGMACIANGVMVNVSSKMPSCDRKRVPIDFTKMRDIDRARRTNIRSLAAAMKVPKTTIHRRIKEGKIRPHSNALKPYLSEQAKKARLQFCLSMLEPSEDESQPRKFKSMYNYVHIDEKWFYMTKEAESYYLLPEEEEPHRTCKSKRFIPKVMFLAAVARPRFDANQNEEFSGKIGIFPFVFKEPARRSSKNRPAGTLETKAILSVTKDIIRSCLINQVLPAIQSKWPPSSAHETIFIQQDNAKPHIQPFDLQFVEAATKDGFDIRLSNQPPSSPDMNVLDLGYFRAIQSLQHQEAPKTIDELVNAVEKSFEELSVDSLNRVFVSLQACMVEVMKVHEGNNYKLPHIGKNQLIRSAMLPSQLECESSIMESALAHLQNLNQGTPRFFFLLFL